MKNPFVYGKLATGDAYLPREKVEVMLRTNIESSQNTVIYGGRRVGKTSFVHHVAQSLKGYDLVYVDFLLSGDPRSIVEKIAQATITAASKRGFFESALKALGTLRPTVSYDPNTGLPSVSVTVDHGASEAAQSVECAIDALDAVAAKRKILVMFDEFQSVAKADPSGKTLGAMRSRIQFQNNTPYIYSGSDRNKMSDLFTSHDSPFYKSAQAINIAPFPADEIWNFIENRFSAGKVTLAPECRPAIEALGLNCPGDLQQICSFVWMNVKSDGRRKAYGSDIEAAITTILDAENEPFEKLAERTSPVQFRLLKTIAQIGGESVYSQPFLKTAGIRAPGSLTKAANQLASARLLRKSKEGWHIENPFFALWLKRLS